MPVRLSAQRTTFAVEQFDGPDDSLMSTLSTSAEHRSGSSLTIGGCGCPGCMSDRKALYINADQRGGGDVVNGRPSFDVSEAAVQLTRGAAGWGPLGQATTVTYAFRSSASVLPNNVQTFSSFSAVQIQTTLNALASWSDVAGIVFERQDDGTGYSNNATILFGNYATGAAGAAAFAYTPGSRAINSTSGDVWVNISQTNNNNSLPLWGYGTLTLVHEIGHSIGLRHPSDYNASEGVSITYSADASYAEDSNQYTVMSYFRETNTGASYGANRYAAAPLLDDIAAAQLLYGANMSTRTGDTTYGFNSTAGRAWFSATLTSAVPIFAVWDAGGIDTFDFSGYNGAQLMDLRQGAFSNMGTLIGNVSIAIGAVIENAIGGSGDDTIYGNSADNRITPGAGNNRVDGGLGTDTLVFSGAMSSYTITITGREGFITGAEGTTRFLNVEFLAFSDMTIAAPAGTGALTLSGDMTNDTINGSEFGDTLFGAGGNDVINGLAGNDQLTGGRGNDTLNGGSGDDLIYIDQGNDIIAGGEGVDTLDSSLALGGLQIDLQLGTISGGGMGVDTVSGIERIIGSRFNDVIVGGAEDNYLAAFGGSDTLRGGGGNDELVASAAESGGGADVLKLSDLANSSIASAVSLDGAFDRLARDGVRDAEVIPHATVVATSHGGLEYYAFTVNANQTVTFDIDGAAFDSTLRIFNAAGTELADNDDAQYAGDVGPATDSFLTFTFATAGTYYVQVGQWATATTGYATTPPPAGLAYTLHISVPGHATQPTTLLGSQLFGDAGDDILRSSLGSDTIDGGSGTDTAVFGGTRASYTVTLSGGVTTVSNAEGTDTVTNVERLQFADGLYNPAGAPLTDGPINGTSGADTLNGTSGADVINGLDGDDTINGLAGNDAINGGNGDDVLTGGPGDDTIDGGAGTDTVVFSGSIGSYLISSPQGGGLRVSGPDGVDTVTNVERIRFDEGTYIIASGYRYFEGTSGADTIVGTSASDEIRGLAGNDLINAGGGDDYLYAGLGDDTVDGGAGIDTIFFSGLITSYIITSPQGGGLLVSGPDGLDRVTNVERITFDDGTFIVASGYRYWEGSNNADTIFGTFRSDEIRAMGGDDVLRGFAGDDYIYAGLGDDDVDGGDGIDTIFFSGLITSYIITSPQGGGLIVSGPDGVDRVINVERISFDDGTFIVASGYRYWEGSNNAETIFGTFRSDEIRAMGGDDVLRGFAGDDYIYAGLGDDDVDGGDGLDTVFFSGSRSAYTITLQGGVTTVTGPDGTDRLTNVEQLQFDNGLFDIGGNPVPASAPAMPEVLPALAGDKTTTGPDVLPGVPDDKGLHDGPEVLPGIDDGVPGREIHALGLDGYEATFGGGDDPLWMLTLLPSADGQVGNPGSDLARTIGLFERSFTPDIPESTTINAPVLPDKDGFGLDPSGGGPDIFPAVSGADILGTPGDVFLPLPDGPWVMPLPLDGAMEGFGPDSQDVTFGGGDDPLWMLTLLPSPDGQVGDPWSGHPRTGTDHWH